MRLIDADKFVEYIDAGHLRSGEDLCFSENDVVDMIDKQPTVNQWIPCSERLPKADGTYIVCGKWGSGKYMVGECGFKKADGYFRTAWNFEATAWMPLPEPYRGDEE